MFRHDRDVVLVHLHWLTPTHSTLMVHTTHLTHPCHSHTHSHNTHTPTLRVSCLGMIVMRFPSTCMILPCRFFNSPSVTITVSPTHKLCMTWWNKGGSLFCYCNNLFTTQKICIVKIHNLFVYDKMIVF